MDFVRRFVFALFVVALSFSTSGLSSLLVPEPCAVGEIGDTDSTCPPSCVTCGCCHRSVDVTRIEVTVARVREVAEPPTFRDTLRAATPREVLHVPKSLLS